MSTTSDTPTPAAPSPAPTPTPATGTPVMAPLSAKERLDAAQRDLRKLRERIQRSTWLTVGVAALLVLVMGGYAYYLSRLWNEFTQPEGLVDMAAIMIDENLPKTRQSLETQIIAAGPSWAMDLSREMVGSIPEARKKFESFAIDQLDTLAQEASLMTEQEFSKFLQKNRPLIEREIKELAANPKLADESFAALVAALEEDMQVDFRSDAAYIFKTIKSTNTNWRKILAGAKLTDEETLERRVLTLARRLQLEQTDPEQLKSYDGRPATRPAPKAQPKQAGTTKSAAR